jgi:hypothetical protein
MGAEARDFETRIVMNPDALEPFIQQLQQAVIERDKHRAAFKTKGTDLK